MDWSTRLEDVELVPEKEWRSRATVLRSTDPLERRKRIVAEKLGRSFVEIISAAERVSRSLALAVASRLAACEDPADVVHVVLRVLRNFDEESRRLVAQVVLDLYVSSIIESLSRVDAPPEVKRAFIECIRRGGFVVRRTAIVRAIKECTRGKVPQLVGKCRQVGVEVPCAASSKR